MSSWQRWHESYASLRTQPGLVRRAGFEEVALDAPEHALLTVGVHRFAGNTPQRLVPAAQLFASSDTC